MILSLSEHKVCITGALKRMTRSEAAEKIKAEEGFFSYKITKDTDILVVADELIKADLVTEKVRKALVWDIDLMHEEDFYELIC